VVTGGERVRVEVLGPIRVVDGAGADVTPEGALQRRLLALLVLRRGHVVTADAAVDALWPARPPRDPAAALHNHVSRLRRAMPPGAIESVGDGYRLDPATVDVDADRVAAALAAGSAATRTTWGDTDGVLARWQGPAYPELADVDDARIEAARTEELRRRARELRAERRIASGDLDGLVSELTALAEEDPLRERPRALLMDVLAASGRRVEALRAYDDFRRRLGDELGIEPSAALAEQHAALLAGGGADRGWRPVHRVPQPATSLVGRDDALSAVATLAADRRVVTLVGPGGVGKTRLLVEVGRRLRSSDPDRPVVLCELATAASDAVAEVVAAGLGIDARPGVPLVERIGSVIGDSEVVVLLDNCEHVLERAADLVHRLVESCPGAHVVATSRERLRVAGEHVHPVPPLETGHAAAPAVQLFLDRARAVAPAFAPGPEDLAQIVQIVRRLDGLPLAIELAAARLLTHEVAEVAEGLDRRFALLSAGYRTSARHESLSAAISWSFDLLDERLQETFAAVAVFAGAFTAEDAAAVCGADTAIVRDHLAELTERSLVMRAPGRRYVLLETLRAYGAERLVHTARDEVARGRHARHQVDWVQRAHPRLLEPGTTVLADIDAAVPELRVALSWLLDHGEVELAGRLVVALFDYGFMRLRPDVLGWAERVATADAAERSPLAPSVWVGAAYARWMAGDVAGYGVRAQRALHVATSRGGDIPADVATTLGSYELFEGRLDEAVRWYRLGLRAAGSATVRRLFTASTEVLALAYAGDPAARSVADELLDEVGTAPTPCAAYAWYCAGEADLAFDPQRAHERFTRAIDIAEQTHASFVTGVAGASRASIDARTGDVAVAAREFRQLIAHWRRAGMWSTQWTMLRSIAALLARAGRHRDAAVLVAAVLTTDAGHRVFGADEVALRDLDGRLASLLGPEAHGAARREGAALDGVAAVEHALRALAEV